MEYEPAYNERMPDYARPPIPRQVFYDSEGAVIDYGNRWRGESPPEDTYSVTSNLERFAPLHAVADVLIEYLASNYAVEVSEDVAFAEDLLRERNDVLRAVRVVPANDEQAPLTFVYTDFPGVVLHAGLLHDFPFPGCGCDACDETAETAAHELERIVLTVAADGFTEWVDPEAWLSVGYALSSADGRTRQRGETIAGGLPPAKLQTAGERLRRLPGGWQPWNPRT